MKRKSATRDTEMQNTLLGDLESIRSLLEIPAPPLREDRSEVPMLDDMVDGTLAVNEDLVARRVSLDDATPRGRVGLADDTIKGLLGDTWRSSTQQILNDARVAMAGHSGAKAWAPQHADAFTEALKQRLDHTLDAWLAESVSARVGELRAALLATFEDEMTRFRNALTDEDDHAE